LQNIRSTGAAVVVVVFAASALAGCGTGGDAMTITPQAAKQPFAARGFRFLEGMSPPRNVRESDGIITDGAPRRPAVGELTVYRATRDAQRACAPSRQHFCGTPVYRVRNVTLAPDPAWSTPDTRRRMLAALRTLGTPVRLN
jgi:hypothetical protein